MYVIGVTGGVGSGKSALLQYLKDNCSCRILLADEAAHEVEKPGGAIYRELTQLLEEAKKNALLSAAEEDEAAVSEDAPVLNSDGTICAKTMAALIFADKALLEKVNSLVHPAVWDYVKEAVADERKAGKVRYFFLEAALLIECGYRAMVDEMWYIYCNEAVRRQRLKDSRGYSDEKIDSIMASQLSEEEFRAGTDYVIDNSGSLEDAFAQIDRRLSGIGEV